MKKGLGPSAVQSFLPFLDRQSSFFLEDLLATPDSYATVIRRYVYLLYRMPHSFVVDLFGQERSAYLYESCLWV